MEELSNAGGPNLATDDVLENIPYGICILNLDGTHSRVNHAYLEITDYKESEIIGTHVTKIAAEKDTEKVSEALEKCLAKSGGESLEFVTVTKQGKEFPVNFNVSLLEDSSGEPAGFVVTIRNITERKRLEADRLKNKLAIGTAEIATGDIVREFGVRVTAEEMGIPALLKHLAELSVQPPPDNLLRLMVAGVRMTLGERGVEVGREKIRKILTPVVREFLRRVLSLSEEYCLEIPREYREFEGKLAKEQKCGGVED